jgi:hypothetical protein
MLIPVNERQRHLFKKAGVEIRDGKEYSDAEVAEIESIIGSAIVDALDVEGDDYKTTDIAIEYENLMDYFVALQN